MRSRSIHKVSSAATFHAWLPLIMNVFSNHLYVLYTSTGMCYEIRQNSELITAMTCATLCFDGLLLSYLLRAGAMSANLTIKQVHGRHFPSKQSLFVCFCAARGCLTMRYILIPANTSLTNKSLKRTLPCHVDQ